jgi:hypothetical protein
VDAQYGDVTAADVEAALAGGAAAVYAAVQSKAEPARQLAYRLYTLCERKNWAEEKFEVLICSGKGLGESFIKSLNYNDPIVLMLGANPYASNGSLCTAPDYPGRLQAIRARGGKVVVVDPRRTKTAQESDEWIAIRPGTDGLFLAALIHVMFSENLVAVEPRIASLLNGLDDMREAVVSFTPARVAPVTGIAADTIVRIAHELAGAPTAAVYGRIGVNTVAFGTTNAWLIDAINVLTAQNVSIVDLLCDPRSYEAANCSSDGFHPNDRGYAFIAEAFLAAIRSPSLTEPQATCPQTVLVAPL